MILPNRQEVKRKMEKGMLGETEKMLIIQAYLLGELVEAMSEEEIASIIHRTREWQSLHPMDILGGMYET